MSNAARVESIDQINAMRVALIKFAEIAGVALADAESEGHRAEIWLETEARIHWEHQLRNRKFNLERAEERLRMKKLFKDPAGAKQSFIDEEKAVQVARQKVAEAETKIANVKRSTQTLKKEMTRFRGATGRFTTVIQTDVPSAVERLAAMILQLEQYASLSTPTIRTLDDAQSSGVSMAQGDAMLFAGIPIDLQQLRLRTQQAIAAEASAEIQAAADWLPDLLRSADVTPLTAIDADRDALQPGQYALVTLAEADRRVYLERVPGRTPDDSGWVIGPVDRAPASPVRTGLKLVLAGDPSGLEKILALPPGFLIIIDAGAVHAIYDASNTSQWNKPEQNVEAAHGDG